MATYKKSSTKGVRPVKVTAAERTFALASLMLLPKALKKPRVGAMLAEAIRNPDVARKLEKNARQIFKECGCTIPPGVTIRVHRSTAKTIHLVLPDEKSVKKSASPQVHLKDSDLLSEGLTQAGSKAQEATPTGPAIPKGRWGGDDGGGDHGDLGKGANWYNTGNSYNWGKDDDFHV